jgi:16S rRNA (guanine527-N7)-methyltransferase
MIEKYFPGFSPAQLEQFSRLPSLYLEWNSRINVVSRKDIENLEIHHILFSLAIAKFFSFRPGTSIMDAGTGGGFPGIPLAIYFPDIQFTLVDSIGKKIKVVEAITNELGLKNVTPVCSRVENIVDTFDFVVGRAVTGIPGLFRLLRSRVGTDQKNNFPNGILYLTGGDVEEDMENIGCKFILHKLSDQFRESFFETKKLIHLWED